MPVHLQADPRRPMTNRQKKRKSRFHVHSPGILFTLFDSTPSRAWRSLISEWIVLVCSVAEDKACDCSAAAVFIPPTGSDGKYSYQEGLYD